MWACLYRQGHDPQSTCAQCNLCNACKNENSHNTLYRYTHTYKLNYNYDEVFFPTNRQKCSVSVLCGFTSVHTGLMRP